MKRLVMFAAVAAVLTSCQIFGIVTETGNGVATEMTLVVKDFDALSVPAMIDVVYTQTPGDQSLTFTCDENLVDYYLIEVKGNTLVVDTQPGILSLTPRVNTVLTVNSPVLNSVKLSGSGDCTINSPISAEDGFKVSTSGSGDIEINGDVTCKSFSASTSGSGEIEISGIKSKSAEFTTTGSGDIEVDMITADRIKASTSGKGSISLVCKDAGDIEARTSGSGSIYLSGNARSLDQKSSGSGRVKIDNFSVQHN